MNFPTSESQIARLETPITNLDRVLENKTAYLGRNPANFISEMILVLEVAGTLDDFYKAVSKTSGFEFLAEHQTEIPPDDSFYIKSDAGERTDKPVGARLFLTMTNQQALTELVSYWREYKKPIARQKFKRGTTKFRNLFEQLKDIRPYSVEDRLRDTGFGTYVELMRDYGTDEVYFEIELAYKSTPQGNERAYAEVAELIDESGGQVVHGSLTIIPEINYHAFIAKAPINCFGILNENTNISFLKSQQILFFRPVGQSISDGSIEEGELARDQETEIREVEPQGEPIVALFDGLPLQNHSALSNRLIVDDPDNFGENYLAEKRNHGTAMASLILNGDLGNEHELPLSRPIYVRPIMKTEANGLSQSEYLPDDKLPIDLVHRAVKRMFEGDGGVPPTAPNIRVINFSIGDSFRPFHNNLSAWAKLIDWLSFKYNVLFIISAGNKTDDIVLNITEQQFDALSIEDREKETIKSIITGNLDRKILTPAESLNSLTVGACHTDFSQVGDSQQRINIVTSPHLLSPISRIGFGYNNSVKPEILMPGGIKLYRRPIRQPDAAKTQLRCEGYYPSNQPGNKIAIPGNLGEINKYGYSCGTSNATALTTRLAAQLYELLLELNTELPYEHRINPDYFTVILKSLLVHGASWGDAHALLEEIVKNVPGVAGNYAKKHLLPYLGYGSVDSERVLYCTEQRVTLIGYGELSIEEGKNAHIYKFPLPPSIGQQRIKKRLAVTLAWFSPLNFNTAKYRKAHLFYDNLDKNGHLTLSRDTYDFRVAQKGTVQHDILLGDNADAFIDGTSLNIKVNCRDDASGLTKNDKIRYALIVTLEIQEAVGTEIYEEVQLRLRQQIRPRI
ncbi:hypothetical protein GCM10022216_02290 [Sphingobacterium kyonggiense]|uniref:Peptidase S8/S53 domain-containing protein n=1 Tax=Sphingobacterium kyonggiense TaxID=714075 RepID=A0ABP7Y7N3_9SPHI